MTWGHWDWLTEYCTIYIADLRANSLEEEDEEKIEPEQSQITIHYDAWEDLGAHLQDPIIVQLDSCLPAGALALCARAP